MTETCEGRSPLLNNGQNWKDERGKDLTLEREKQVAFAALDQEEQRLAVFCFFDGGAVRYLLRASRPLSGRADHDSGFFIKHKRELVTLPVLL